MYEKAKLVYDEADVVMGKEFLTYDLMYKMAEANAAINSLLKLFAKFNTGGISGKTLTAEITKELRALRKVCENDEKPFMPGALLASCYKQLWGR